MLAPTSSAAVAMTAAILRFMGPPHKESKRAPRTPRAEANPENHPCLYVNSLMQTRFDGPMNRTRRDGVDECAAMDTPSSRSLACPNFWPTAEECDGTTGSSKDDDAVPTGGTYTYTWLVPDRAGPGPHDGSSVMWMYHSHTDEVADTYAGLMGPIEVTARGLARKDGSPKDVDREIFTLFSVMNENSSPFLDANEHKYERPFQSPEGDGTASRSPT